MTISISGCAYKRSFFATPSSLAGPGMTPRLSDSPRGLLNLPRLGEANGLVLELPTMTAHPAFRTTSVAIAGGPDTARRRAWAKVGPLAVEHKF